MSHILVIGSGVRECVIIKKLLEDYENNKPIKITCLGNNNNPYIAKSEYCDLHIVSKYELDELYQLLEKIDKPDFAIIGSENPIELGYADYLESLDIPCIAPLKKYSQIESSKIYARKFIEKYG